jgi:hypothetical protein
MRLKASHRASGRLFLKRRVVIGGCRFCEAIPYDNDDKLERDYTIDYVDDFRLYDVEFEPLYHSNYK